MRKKHKHGLLAQSVLSRLHKIGINIKPYFVYVETVDERTAKFPSANFRIETITDANVLGIIENFPDKKRIWPDTWQRRMKEGEIGLVLWDGINIAGFTWAGRSAFPTPSGRPVFVLDADEVYLHDMVIAERYRGASLASELRFACYQRMWKENIRVAYSATLYFNHPAIRFKEKIGAKRTQLRVESILFRKFKSDFRLRRYQPD